MENNILQSGVTLRTIRAADYDNLVSDLNFNFQQILNLPVFRGIKGDDGNSTVGSRGTRGSNWIFADAVSFIANYELVVSGTQITTTFLNAQLASDQSKLMSTLSITTLLDMDTFVLPNGNVVQFDEETSSFVKTALSFSSISTLNEEDVRSIVTQMTSGQASTNPVNTLFVGAAKNADDTKPGLNVSYNNNSIIDIPVLGAQPGVNLSDYLFYAPKESFITGDQYVNQIVGSAAKYHTLVQNTLNEQTVHYVPGIDDYNALTVLQNNLKNGMILGYKDSDSLRSFSRIYNNGSGLMMTSSYSPLAAEYSSLYLSDSDVSMRAIRNFVLSCVSLDLTNTEKVNHNQLLLDSVQSALGSSTIDTIIKGKSIKVQWEGIPSSVPILATGADGTLSPSQYIPVNSMSTPAPSTTQQKLNLVTQFYAEKVRSDLKLLIDAVNTKIDNFTVDASAIFDKGFISADNSGEDNMNAFITVGTRYLSKPTNGHAYQNYPFTLMNDQSAVDWSYAILDVNYASNTVDDVTSKCIVQTIRQNVSNGVTRIAYRVGRSMNGAVSFTWSGWSYSTTVNSVGDGMVIDLNNNGEVQYNHASRSIDETVTFTDGVVASAIKFDQYGHPIEIITKDLDERYMTKTDVESALSEKLGASDTAVNSEKLNNLDASEYFTKSEVSKRVELANETIDFEGAPVLYKTLVEHTTISFQNLVVNKTISLEASGDFALQIPNVQKIAGSYNGQVLNLIQFYCTNVAGTGTIWCTISQALEE